jgi:hypothetical protein
MISVKRIASNEDRLIPAEKWLACFRRGGRSFIREFMAEGYYEAYDAVLTYAEKRRAEVIWFREKRNCGHHMNKNYQALESVCTYCNAIFDGEALPCKDDDCDKTFCSRACMQEHHNLRHHGNVRKP